MAEYSVEDAQIILLETKVARLEAELSEAEQKGVAQRNLWQSQREKAALTTALRKLIAANCMTETIHAKEEAKKLLDALKDTAKGWPGEQAEKALRWCKANHLGTALTCIALDALEVNDG